MRESGCFYPPQSNSLNDSEIRFSAGGLDVSVETRATPVTELATFNVLASTGSAGSESQAWAPVAVTKSGSTYLTGKYWPAADPSYHFYASNAALTFAAAGSTVTADGSTDVVCAYLPSPTYGEPNALTFDHIYARVGSFSVATQSGYEISAVSATLKNGVSGGTYNLRTGAWSGLSAASDRACASFSGSTSSQSSSNDIWLVPGTYTISVSYTLTKGEYVVPFTKTGSVTLVAGKTNNISTTAVGGSASEIVFSVSLASWSPNSVAMDWLSDYINPHPFSIGDKTIYFARGNLKYDESAVSGHEWRIEEIPNVSGNTLSSPRLIRFFAWGTSGYNEKQPWMSGTPPTQWGPAIEYREWTSDSPEWDWCYHNTIYDANDMIVQKLRILSKDEWSYLIDHVNPSSAVIDGVQGVLLFSDDYTHPEGLTAIVNGFDSEMGSYRNIFNTEQFAQMDDAGAVFIPKWSYWTSTANSLAAAYFLELKDRGVSISSTLRGESFLVRPVFDPKL